MHSHHILAATVLLLVASILHGAALPEYGSSSSGRRLQQVSPNRASRPPRPPPISPPPPPPPFPAAQPIRTALGTNRCIDVAGGQVVNGAKLVQTTCDASSQTQKFIVLNAGDGVIRIYSAVNIKRCWTAWSLSDGAPPANDYGNSAYVTYNGAVRLWDCTFTDESQQFKPTVQGAGWALQPKFSTQNCVGLNVTSPTETLLVMQPCSVVSGQTFAFTITGWSPSASQSPPPSPPPSRSSPPPTTTSPPPLRSSPPSPPPSPPPLRSSPPPPLTSPPPAPPLPKPPKNAKSPPPSPNPSPAPNSSPPISSPPLARALPPPRGRSPRVR
ncbi:hypothetical protein VaNZ11_002867 [Volvox africanus]|uniref:Ricin B lectin domain-containing protein n=1 Tax=Volvox africanus TaxID=51714 RepID=A0ABQ5RU88_9CHLO|nr:hypothetical protein VaNZ11_002867 [Volvox africanus]